MDASDSLSLYLKLNRTSLPTVQVLDLYSPRWECLDDGAYTTTIPWLKQRGTYSCFCGNKLYTLKPSMHEKLWELQVCCGSAFWGAVLVISRCMFLRQQAVHAEALNA